MPRPGRFDTRLGGKPARDLPTVSHTTSPHKVAQAILTLDAVLREEYGSDYAYIVMGNGNQLAASTIAGRVLPAFRTDVK